MTTPPTVTIAVGNLERLEFSARLDDDGSFEAFGLRRIEWPDRIEVSGIILRSEESDIRDDEQMTMAWYVPE